MGSLVCDNMQSCNGDKAKRTMNLISRYWTSNFSMLHSTGTSQNIDINSISPPTKRIKISTQNQEPQPSLDSPHKYLTVPSVNSLVQNTTPNPFIFPSTKDNSKAKMTISISTTIDSMMSRNPRLSRNPQLSYVVTGDFDVGSPVADLILGSPLEGLT